MVYLNQSTYPEPVQSLLTLGEVAWQEWDDYLALGFSRDHIPDLIRMATNRYLIVEAAEPEFWAPIHIAPGKNGTDRTKNKPTGEKSNIQAETTKEIP